MISPIEPHPARGPGGSLRRVALFVTLSGTVLACGGARSETTATAKAEKGNDKADRGGAGSKKERGDGSAKRTKAGKSGSGAGGVAADRQADRDNVGTNKAGSPPDPLVGKSKAQICSEDSLLLIQHDYDDIQRNFNKLCCGSDGLGTHDDRCSLDWPFNDVPACSAYDGLRNGIYARYGYPFEKSEWKKEFEGQSWYHRRDDFSESWLSPEAKRNVAKLKELKEKGTACSP